MTEYVLDSLLRGEQQPDKVASANGPYVIKSVRHVFPNSSSYTEIAYQVTVTNFKTGDVAKAVKCNGYDGIEKHLLDEYNISGLRHLIKSGISRQVQIRFGIYGI